MAKCYIPTYSSKPAASGLLVGVAVLTVLFTFYIHYNSNVGRLNSVDNHTQRDRKYERNMRLRPKGHCYVNFENLSNELLPRITDNRRTNACDKLFSEGTVKFIVTLMSSAILNRDSPEMERSLARVVTTIVSIASGLLSMAAISSLLFAVYVHCQAKNLDTTGHGLKEEDCSESVRSYYRTIRNELVIEGIALFISSIVVFLLLIEAHRKILRYSAAVVITIVFVGLVFFNFFIFDFYYNKRTLAHDAWKCSNVTSKMPESHMVDHFAYFTIVVQLALVGIANVMIFIGNFTKKKCEGYEGEDQLLWP